MDKFNLEFLVSVSVRDKSIDKRYSFLPEIKKKKLFSRKEYVHREAGLYFNSDEKVDILSDEYIVIDNKVYDKPYVYLSFADKSSRKILFNNVSEANKYAETLTVSEKWI